MTTVLVVGKGEVGEPITELSEKNNNVISFSEPVNDFSGYEDVKVDIMHICFGYNDDFVNEAARYVNAFRPSVTIINSTVPIGTSRKIEELTGISVVNSPVKGNIADGMKSGLMKHVKYLGATSEEAANAAANHFESLGIRTEYAGQPEATELAKLLETTYYATMIAFHQEAARMCKEAGVSYTKVGSFWDRVTQETDYRHMRPFMFPGKIGGHCLMPNVKLLKEFFPSELLEFIEKSNQKVDSEDLHKFVREFIEYKKKREENPYIPANKMEND